MKEFFIGLLVLVALLLLSVVVTFLLPFIVVLGFFLKTLIIIAFFIFAIWLLGKAALLAIDRLKK